MIDNILFSSATDLAAAIQAKEVSAVEVLEAHLAQIEARNPELNAIVIEDVEGARARAQEADAATARGERWGALHGVPFTLKDGFATRGMRSTVGFPPFDHVPDYDATIVTRLKRAGAILMGKSNTPAMMGDFQTHNVIFGRTNNPVDLSRTPGGSSGGAVAAIASGMTPFDIGTDLSGSIRIPAHFVGIYGLKPTEHRMPMTGIMPIPFPPPPNGLLHMAVLGPLARTVEDLATIYQVLAGPDGLDVNVPPVPVEPIPTVALEGLRVAVAPKLGGFPVNRATQAAVTAFGEAAASHGAHVEQPAFPESDFSDVLQGTGALTYLMMEAFQPLEKPKPTFEEYATMLSHRNQARLAWEDFFESWDVLVTPVAMIPAFAHCEPQSPLLVDGEPVPYVMICTHTAIFNYTGHPAVVIPYTTDSEGLPIGIQLVGKRWSESRLLAIAQALSAAIGRA